MAIVKANYTRSRGKIKASVRYIQHRPGRDGERLVRPLFGNDGPMTRDEAYNLLDQAPKGTKFYRLIISPDPRLEDTDRDLNLKELTGQTLASLSDKLGTPVRYIGAVHEDHAPHRHVHVIAMLQGKLTREHFKLLRQQATELGQFQRLARDQARGLVRGHQDQQITGDGSTRPQRRLQPAQSTGGGSAASAGKTGKYCPVCHVENCLIHDQGLDRGY